jgi:predicted Zn-dependent peptidase
VKPVLNPCSARRPSPWATPFAALGFFGLLTLCPGGVSTVARSRPQGPVASAFTPPAIFERVEEVRLENGMLFLLLPRHEVPVVSGRIRFRAGNVDCPAGRSGVAHMFEHMAFMGTDRIGVKDRPAEIAVEDSLKAVGRALCAEVALHEKGDTTRVRLLRTELDRLGQRQYDVTNLNEFSRLYDRYSYYFNAWTNTDFTSYETDVPANALEVWMLMESERLQNPSFRGFYRERDVVIEERREGEDDPTDQAWEALDATAFMAHPYHLPVIGYMSDLQTLTQEAAEEFYRTYYVPGNAVCALVGDFDPVEAKRLITAYFGDIPAGPAPPPVHTVEPPQRGMRRTVLRQGTERELFLAFHGFVPTDPRYVTATLLADVLSRDITSRLDRRLDIKEKAATSVWASASGTGDRYPGLLLIHAKPLEGFTNEQVEKMVWEELAGVISNPVTPGKLKEIQASRRKRFYRELVTSPASADFLVGGQMVYGDWRQAVDVVRRTDEATADEVTALARQMFTPDRATVIMVEPEDQAVSEQGGQR